MIILFVLKEEDGGGLILEGESVSYVRVEADVKAVSKVSAGETSSAKPPTVVRRRLDDEDVDRGGGVWKDTDGVDGRCGGAGASSSGRV